MVRVGRDVLGEALKNGAAPEVWVRFPRLLGDVVFSIPFFSALQADWNAVAAESGKRLRWIALGHDKGASLFSEANPTFISECAIESGGQSKPDPWHLLRRWRKQRPAAVLNLSQSARLMLAATLARVPVRAGIADNRLGFFYTHPFLYRDLPVHLVNRYEPLLELLTGKRDLLWTPLTPDLLGGLSGMEKLRVGGWGGKPYVCLAFGTGGYTKRWNPEVQKWSELARIFTGQGLDVVWIGGPAEKSLGAELCALVPGSIDLTGLTTLPEVCAIQHGAYGIVAIDTGLAHTGAATGRPTVTINNHTSEALYLPLGPFSLMVRGALADVSRGQSKGDEPAGTSAHRVAPLRVVNLLHALAEEAAGSLMHPALHP